eukprot:UN11872
MLNHPKAGDEKHVSLVGKDEKSKTHKFEYQVTQGKRSADPSKKVYNWVISKDTIMDFVVFKCPDCDMTCESEEALGVHTAERHEVCECCGQWVLPGMFYNRHKSKEFRHHKLFIRCGECKEIYLRTNSIEGEFTDHQNEMHGDGGSRYRKRRY